MGLNTLFNVNFYYIKLSINIKTSYNFFKEPNENDPLNKEAGEVMRRNIEEFKDIVRKTLKGGNYKGESFQKFI